MAVERDENLVEKRKEHTSDVLKDLNDNLTKLLQEDRIEEFTVVRKRFSNDWFYFYDLDLSGKKLDKAFFSKCLFENVDFSNVSLTTAIFRGAKIENASFSGVDLADINFAQAKLSNVDFSNANLSKTNFTETVFDTVCFDGATGADTIFFHARMSGVTFHEKDGKPSQISGNFEGCHLIKAKAKKAIFKQSNFNESDLSSGEFIECDFAGSKFARVKAKNTIFDYSQFQKCDTSGHKTDFSPHEDKDLNEKATSFEGANFSGAQFSNGNFKQVSFKNTILHTANFNNSDMSHADFTGAEGKRTQFIETKFGKARLENAKFKLAHFKKADFAEADLRGASIRKTDLTSTHWGKAKIDSNSSFQYSYFNQEHGILEDGSDQICLPRWLNWSKVRKLGSLPMFGISWTGLAASLITIKIIRMANDARASVDVAISGQVPQNDIPVPDQLWIMLVSFILLVVGSTLYKFGCPDRVQTFSEVEWVEQHHRPRIHYFEQMLKKPNIQLLSFSFLVSGASIAVILMLCNVFPAIYYAFTH
ncbi:MAG: pentapeptide repeat-containing protein [Rhodospirillales bacterium]|nr:pentapeptide repeat-containing protein [Rhodospirillales bacterium]